MTGERVTLGDPGASPRFAKQGEATRENVAWHEGPIGPMRAEVTVTPIRRRDRAVYFEVIAEWGPGPNGEDVPGLSGLPTRHVVDTAAVDDYQAAQRLARRAVDLLRDPEPYKPGQHNRAAIELPRAARELGIPLLRQQL
jgi:hypothetical protein